MKHNKHDEMEYAPLNGDTDDTESQDHIRRHVNTSSGRKIRISSLIMSWTITGLVSMAFFWQWLQRGPSNPIFPQALYSPAQDIVKYHSVMFRKGEGDDVSKYEQLPSREVDNLWEDLFNIPPQVISSSSAKKLQNITSPIPGNEGHYIVMLDVFHQLHCLNRLRKALLPEYYKDEEHDVEHLLHCVGSIRQSLMCTVDVTPIVFQWHDELGSLWHDENIFHTCRDFDAVMKWSLDNTLGDQNWMKFPNLFHKEGKSE